MIDAKHDGCQHVCVLTVHSSSHRLSGLDEGGVKTVIDLWDVTDKTNLGMIFAVLQELSPILICVP